MAATCDVGIKTFEKIQPLREDVEGRRIVRLGKRLPNARKLVMSPYRNPRVTAADVSASLKVTPKTANDLVKDLMKLKILAEVTGNRRNRIFLFSEYVRLFSK